MRTTCFFKNIDRSESVESFIEEKLETVKFELDSRWIISKNNHLFEVKALIGKELFKLSNKDIYFAIGELIHKIKRNHFHKVA